MVRVATQKERVATQKEQLSSILEVPRWMAARTGDRGWGIHYLPEILRTGMDCFSSRDVPPPTTVQSLRPYTSALYPIPTKGRQHKIRNPSRLKSTPSDGFKLAFHC